MKFTSVTGLLALPISTLALALPFFPPTHLSKKADETKSGYLAVYWTTEDESVYFALSSNEDALGFEAINGGKAVVSPTLGTKAIRDTTIVRGEGDDEGKYYIIGTDLDIDTVCLLLSHLSWFMWLWLTLSDELGCRDTEWIQGTIRLGEYGLG